MRLQVLKNKRPNNGISTRRKTFRLLCRQGFMRFQFGNLENALSLKIANNNQFFGCRLASILACPLEEKNECNGFGYFVFEITSKACIPVCWTFSQLNQRFFRSQQIDHRILLSIFFQINACHCALCFVGEGSKFTALLIIKMC